MLSPVLKPQSLSKHVEEELTKAIRQGQFQPLQKIPTEHELCAIFNVSRTVVREAIRGLRAKGIVDVKKGSGVFVSEMSIQNASEILNLFFRLTSNNDLMLSAIQVRMMIEPMVASKSAELRTEEHLIKLKGSVEKLQKCPLDDKIREAELDNQFHRILLESLHNPVLSLLIEPIFNLIPKFKQDVFAKTISNTMAIDKEIMIHYHGSIFNAIADGNAAVASKLMKEHLDVTLKNYNRFTEK